MSEEEYFYGIDFGTTNTSMVKVDKTLKEIDAEPEYYGDSHGEPFPSIFGIDDEGNKICGREAWEKRRQLQKTSSIITSIKKHLGQKTNISIGNKTFTPIEITTKILKSLKKQNNLDNRNIDAVFSIPVGFDKYKRQDLRKAAKNANINIKSFVKESTAALFMYYEEVKRYDNVLVFDWGGGTLDISLLKNIQGKIKELAVNSMNFAGDDIDLKIARMIHRKLAREKGINIAFEEMKPHYQDLLIVQAEEAKKELSFDDLANITMVNYGDFKAVNENISIDLFTNLLENNIKEAVENINSTIEDGQITKIELDCIIMIGGSSKIRPLQKEVKRRFSNTELIFPENSEWKCAEGAALLSIDPGVYKLNHDIGLILSDNSFFPLFRKDQKVENRTEHYEFGLTEDTRQARLVFAKKNSKEISKKILDYESLNVFGFLDEKIVVKAIIDKDLIFRASINSSKQNEENKISWDYDKLNFYYDISEIFKNGCS